jgi:predicted XRE-type DNA-binding protein
MTESLEVEQDPVLEALSVLSEVAISSASDLADLNEDLAGLRQSRLQGWTWRRIISDADTPNPLSLLSKIAADLARACGGFRRALAQGLRREGLQITEIASIFEVSRQRVSALIRSNGSSGTGESEEPAPESMD